MAKVFVLMTQIQDPVAYDWDEDKWYPIAVTADEQRAIDWSCSSPHRALEEFELDDLSSFLDGNGEFLPYGEEG